MSALLQPVSLKPRAVAPALWLLLPNALAAVGVETRRREPFTVSQRLEIQPAGEGAVEGD
jgi:hypothetical protein